MSFTEHNVNGLIYDTSDVITAAGSGAVHAFTTRHGGVSPAPYDSLNFADNKGDGWDRPILNDTKVFQYGDALAIVCADSEAHARAGAETGHEAREAECALDVELGHQDAGGTVGDQPHQCGHHRLEEAHPAQSVGKDILAHALHNEAEH